LSAHRFERRALFSTSPHVLPRAAAISRLAADHEILLSHVEQLSELELAAPYRTSTGPLGDFCESLHDLAAHILMWNEINMAILSEANAGRRHWSLDSRWETPDAGRCLNLAGVEAGRCIPAPLLLHRLCAVHDAVVAEISRYGDDAWLGSFADSGETFGEVVQRSWTVPGHDAFWHAAIHLGRLPDKAAESVSR
jgi:hypothetical protein